MTSLTNQQAAPGHSVKLNPLSGASCPFNIQSPKKHSLFVAHLNAQSLPCHITEITSVLSNFQVHALLISETWLKESLVSGIISVPGYHFIRSDRNRTDVKNGGGVGIYLRDDISFKIIESSNKEIN